VPNLKGRKKEKEKEENKRKTRKFKEKNIRFSLRDEIAMVNLR
jgi:hypothetical protein